MPNAPATQRWVAIDFETATRERTSACALGLAVVEGLEVVAKDYWLIQPPFNEYEWRNTNIHGLGPEDTEFAPEFDALWPQIRRYLTGATLLAHNASFDMGVLRALVETRGLQSPPLPYVCTVSLSRAVFGDLTKHTLDTVCDHCGIALNHHEAASDAAACACIAIECAHATGNGDIAQTIAATGVARQQLFG